MLDTYQFWLFGVHSDYHILIRCWQQVADAIISNGKLLLTLIILNTLLSGNAVLKSIKGEIGIKSVTQHA